MSKTPIRWTPNQDPLVPVAALAFERAAERLAARLLIRDDNSLSRLQAVAGAGFLLVTGAESDLPWVAGIHYLGRDQRAPMLLLPTNVSPSVNPCLLQTGFQRSADGPLAVSLEPALLIPLQGALPLQRDPLIRWLEART